jgi:hypothetical protein
VGAHAIVSLLSSIINDVESIRRMFYRWLSAARAARRRRLLLQAKEEELKFAAIAAAWDKWRERFKDGRLRPLVTDFYSCQSILSNCYSSLIY